MSYPIYINTYRLLGILILIDLSNHGNLNRNPNYVFSPVTTPVLVCCQKKTPVLVSIFSRQCTSTETPRHPVSVSFPLILFLFFSRSSIVSVFLRKFLFLTGSVSFLFFPYYCFLPLSVYFIWFFPTLCFFFPLFLCFVFEVGLVS
jgi:hypothetical protein